MPGPGSGRYTNYIPLDVASAARHASRASLFNEKAAGGKGNFQADLVANAKAILEAGVGDSQMFPSGVDMSFGNAPKLEDTAAGTAGGPSSPYVPALSSPGAIDGAINLDPRALEGQIAPSSIKPNYSAPSSTLAADSDNLGTQSPHITSPTLGGVPINQELVMGKSRGSA